MTDSEMTSPAGERLAKVIARSGLCSRRDAEDWIKGGRVSVNGTIVRTPAFNVAEKDKIKVDGQPLAARKGTRVWLYHKPPGLVVTEKDPEGRPTIFEKLAAEGLPRVLTIGRLDINTEGLLLLTNDGGVKRVLELPSTGWLRRYRVRAFGSITQAQLDGLKDGIEIEGVKYGPIEAILERSQGSNVWLMVSLREGKNREVKNVLGVLGLVVNRLIRVSYGPFQLGDLPIGGVEVVKARVLREQLGKKLAEESGADFDSELPEPVAITQARRAADPSQRMAAPGRDEPARGGRGRANMVDERFAPRTKPEERPIRHRPGRPDMAPPRKPKAEKPVGPARRILFDDGREETFHPPEKRGDKPAGKFGDRTPRREGGDKFAAKGQRPAGKFGDRPPRRDDDKPRPPRRDDDRPRPSAGAGRPARKPFAARDAAPAGERPARKSFGGPKGPRTASDRPERKSFGGPKGPAADRPSRGPRPDGPPRGARPAGGPSRGPRPGGPSRGPRPAGGKPPRKPRP